MLEVNGLHVYYGVIHALDGVSLRVEKGEVVTLLGANGAGKSTTLKTLSGLLRPRGGSISFEGENIAALPAHEIVRRGIVQVPEGRRIFANMTVEENLLLGAYARSDREGLRRDFAYVSEVFPVLKERLGQSAGTLSGGEQQMLAIGRGLMAQPRLLLLDEPSLGLAPVLVQTIFRTLHRIRDEGVTLLLVEQNAHMALSIADRGYVLETGRVTLSGTPEELLRNEAVREAYFGE